MRSGVCNFKILNYKDYYFFFLGMLSKLSSLDEEITKTSLCVLDCSSTESFCNWDTSSSLQTSIEYKIVHYQLEYQLQIIFEHKLYYYLDTPNILILITFSLSNYTITQFLWGDQEMWFIFCTIDPKSQEVYLKTRSRNIN